MLDIVSKKHDEPPELELVEMRPAPPARQLTGYAAKIDTAKRIYRHYTLFLYTVALPLFVAILYYGLLAADRYEVEAHFVIRQPSMSMGQSIGKLLGTSTITRSSDDSHSVNAFIESTSAVQVLQDKLDLRKIVSKAWMDPLWRFPGFFSSGSFESLRKYYNRLIKVKFDGTSGITKLTVQAFDPKDAQAIALVLLDTAEVLVNRLTRRSRTDALRTAEKEVAIAKQHLQQVQDRLVAFRSKEQVIDPTRLSKAVVTTISKLSLEIAKDNAQMMELQQAARNSPQIRTLRTRVASLQKQIDQERAALAGKDNALAKVISDYEQLQLEKKFADKLLSLAAVSRQTALLNWKRQQLYLERIVEPKIPDAPEDPKRLMLVFLIAMASLIVFRAIRSSQDKNSRKAH